MVLYRSFSRRVFEVGLYALFVLVIASIILPFLHVIAISLSSSRALSRNVVTLWPVDFFPKVYQVILASPVFLRSLANTTGLSVVNTTLTIIVALCAGYALASRHFYGRRVFFVFLLIPMYFGGGLIPFYIVVNSYGLNNTYFALILPNLVNIFYIIVFRNAINHLPAEVTESAEIDGANEYTILFRIVFPLILPMVMAFTIFSAVGFWNEWFNVLIFIRDQSKWTLQYMLRSLYSQPNFAGGGVLEGVRVENPELINPLNLTMAAIICTVAPIIVIYPFLQRYFIHGVIVGAVKG